MANRARKFHGDDQRDFLGGPPRVAAPSTLVVDFSLFKEGIGIQTTAFSADINGGYTGTYYIDSAHRADFQNVDTFRVTGTDYADTIQVGDGADIVNSGGGNDLVLLGLGKDKADGGAGIDGYDKSFAGLNAGVTINLQTNSSSVAGNTVKNFEYFHNVIGSDFNDVFTSSATKRGDDTVNGGEGNDAGFFAVGYDRFTGGAGDDTAGMDFSNYTGTAGISTSLANEDSGEGYRGYFYIDNANRLDFGTSENFQVTGTANNDTITTGIGDDVVKGGDGNDVISTSAGLDTLDGGDGVDGVGRDFSLLEADITVNLGAATMTGTAGAITGFEYFAGMQGGFGDDTFLGTTARANDTVNGGAGNDTASFYAGTDVYTGGAGNDRAIVDYSLISSAGIQTSLTADTDGGYKGYFYIDGGNRTDFTSVEAFTITGTVFNDGIQTGDGDDTVTSGAGYDVVQTGAGKDVLDGGDGIDGVGRNLSALNIDVTINLAAGTATAAIGSIKNFEYFAGYSGSQKVDTLVSTHAQANDSVIGGGGNDVLTVFAGTDTFGGGIGVDRLIVDYSAVDAGVGIVTSFNADSNGGFQGYYYINQPNRIDFTSTEAFTITGTKYNDLIITRTGDDTVSGGAGNDVVDTGSGKDVDDGGAGFDGIGRDLSGLLGANITFNLETGKLLGATGSSMKNFEYLYDVKTSSGADTFMTLHTAGNDTVSSGGGNDVMSTFAGYDRFAAGSGIDTLKVDYSGLDTDAGMQASVNVDSTNGGFSGYFYIDGGNRTDFSGTEVFNVTATNNNDTITGGTGGDTLIGLDGRDTLTGNGGADTLDGGAAADSLSGGQGKDTLVAGGGADTLTGGTEADTFVFKTTDFGPLDPFALDRITDFSHSDGDKINLSGIDANKVATGDQAFTFVGSAAFTAAGQVHVVIGAGGFTYLEGNWDANLAADFSIRVDGSAPVLADLVL